MVDIATALTTEMLLMARLGVDRSARRASLRAVSSRDFDETTAPPGELEAKSSTRRPHPASAIRRASGRFLEHVGNLKALDDDRAVALGVAGGERMEDVVALAANLSMQPIHAAHSLGAIVGSFLSPGNHTLRSGKSLECGLQGPWVFDESAVRISDQVGDAAIESDDGLSPRCRVRKLDFADHRDEPLVPVTANRTAFRSALERPVHDRSEVAEFRKTELVSHEAPYLGMRFGETETVSTLALPARSSSDPLEAALPGLIELDKSCAQTLRGTSARNGHSEQSALSSLI